ncbi:MAG: TonB-dependent receptor [Thermoanaerobaculia bacterium]
MRLALAVLLLSMAVPALAQLQTGDLYGTVAGNTGGALAGVTVTLSGVGAPQVQTTDQQGQFHFLNLYPGVYAVKAELQGWSPVEHSGVPVHVGGNAELRIAMSAAVTGEITVTSEGPLLDVRKLNQGAAISAQELDKIPTARDPWSLLSQAPGVLVDRINVGGNESGSQSAFVGTGSRSRDNAYSVDGVLVTDMNQVGASMTYYDFGAFEEVQFTTSSADVTVATSGVTINQVTKRGTNEWRGSGRFLRTDGKYQSDPFLPNGNRIDRVDEKGADAGGPLWKDHLWAWGSYDENEIDNFVQGGQLNRFVLRNSNFKLNFQAGPSDSGVLHYWTNDKLQFGRGAGPQRAPESTLDQTTPQDIFKAEDTWIINPSFVVTALGARDNGGFNLTPKGGLDADIVTSANGVRSGTNFAFHQDVRIDQSRADASYFFQTGAVDHELKFGASYRQQENSSGTVWPHGKLIFAGSLFGFPSGYAIASFHRNRSVDLASKYEAGWLQDTLTHDRWTFNAGLRYDRQTTRNLPSSDPGNPETPGVAPGAPGLFPPINFQGNDAGGFRWGTVAPRLSATYALGEDRKSLVRATFSRYAEQLGQVPLASRVNPLGFTYAYFYFFDTNGNLRLDPNERPSLRLIYSAGINLANPSALRSVNVNDPNLKPSLTDELTLGYERTFGSAFDGGLTVTYRKIHDIPETRLLVTDASGQVRVATAADYVQTGFICTPSSPCVLPNGQNAAPQPVYDLRTGLRSTGGRFYTNGDREQNYLGTTLFFSRRLADRWSLRGYLTYADWKWHIGDEFRRFDDPTNTITTDLGFADGNDVVSDQSFGKPLVFTGARWSFNVNGLYQIAPDRPWGFNTAAMVTGRQGYIVPVFATYASATGQRSVQLTDQIDEFRNDNVFVLDGRIDKDFRFGDVTLNLGIDGFNLTNKHFVLQRDNNARVAASARYAVLETLSPRVFRFGATLRFR